MGNFDISPGLTGTGPTTIKVKPKELNSTGEIIVDVLTIEVAGSQRNITLNQEGKKPDVVTWKQIFKVSITDLEFRGDISGETKIPIVHSYEQKYINDVEQEEYKDIHVSITSSVDWVKTELGPLSSPNGSELSIKSTDRNSNCNSSFDPVQREGYITLKANTLTKTIKLVQLGGEKSYTYRVEPSASCPQAPSEVTSSNTHTGYKETRINGSPAKYEGNYQKILIPFTVPGIASRSYQQFIDGTRIGEYWFTDYGDIATVPRESFTATAHFRRMTSVGGVPVMTMGWKAKFQDGGEGTISITNY